LYEESFISQRYFFFWALWFLPVLLTICWLLELNCLSPKKKKKIVSAQFYYDLTFCLPRKQLLPHKNNDLATVWLAAHLLTWFSLAYGVP
jgi:hypothetical protein